MEYVIFISIVLTVCLAIHYWRYFNSNYKSFDAYLGGEVNNILLRELLVISSILMALGFIFGLIYVGGSLVKIVLDGCCI